MSRPALRMSLSGVLRTAAETASAMAFVWLLTGCDETCDGLRTTVPLAEFHSSGLLADQTAKMDSLQVIGVGVPGDSVLSEATAVKSQLYLPFRIDSDTTAYLFRRDFDGEHLESRVRFVYTRTPRFVSRECGVSYVYTLRDVTWEGNLIDSVTWRTPDIDNAAVPSIDIYFSIETGL